MIHRLRGSSGSMAECATSNRNGVSCKDTRHCGFDNCKMIFMLMVVMWHTMHFSVIEATLTWGASTDSSETNAALQVSPDASFWDRATQRQLSHHPAWIPLITHVVMRYWLWTEKVAVPGFAFLSGYFGKGFLSKPTTPVGYSLHDMERDQRKDRKRWEKTIQMLLVAPLLWQFLQAPLSFIAIGLYTGEWSWASVTSAQLDMWENLGTWYLFALLLWRVMTSVFLSRLKQDGGFPFLVSMALALISEHTNRGGPREMQQRLFVFFPFYVAGLYCNESTWQKIVERGRHLLPCGGDNKESASRLMGCFGILITLVVCQVAPRDTLGWQYSIDSLGWQPHLIFFWQYLLAGSAVASVILLFKTIPYSLVPFAHGNSTLAIYCWHWPLANFFAWGQLPFAYNMVIMKTSLLECLFSRLSPVPAVLAAHAVCYLICVLLGSKLVWNIGLRHLCDPEWTAKWLFPQKDAPKSLPL